ncbi:MAG: 16S rRNA (guanine(527)-N(7))-methyltransferase RsmG [Lachnospiraceae bacterium]|uniref:16S rRNA (guanine(527)-N(7))-methyltransferase RsmG n=1 Tax=Candidatus Merdisoma sp. JLR.KK006 TaxID=3112626 RepID=UPI002FF40631|nr:16S rRNA (guanine(527)-N(7))-methyltransferase RsmG [Lachnospiraceae bacterium]
MEKIKEKFKKLKLELTDQQAVQFFQYYEFLVEKNKVMNLTAIVDFDEVILKHFIDSLMIHQIVIPKGRLIDVGTGAGFPGIPLKIIYPDLDVVLLDSLNKRVQFLNEVIQKLGLEKIIAIHGRAEDLAKKDNYREQFDLCVSRAVANLSTLSEYCIPFVRKEGFFIAYKSGKIQEELESGRRAINILGGIIEEQREVLLPDTDVFRCIVKIRKTGYTPKKYPRKAGMPAKEPLCSK